VLKKKKKGCSGKDLQKKNVLRTYRRIHIALSYSEAVTCVRADAWSMPFMIATTVLAMLILTTFIVVVVMLVQRRRDARRHRGAIELQIRDDLFQNSNDNHHYYGGGGSAAGGSDSAHLPGRRHRRQRSAGDRASRGHNSQHRRASRVRQAV